MADKQEAIVIAGGGTGGHLFPAIAVAQEIKNLKPEIRIFFIASKGRMEEQILPRYGFSTLPLKLYGFSGGLTRRLLALVYFMVAVFRLIRIFRGLKVRGVICFGGYESVPLVLAARLFRVPVFFQEQNVLWGRSVRLLSVFADRIYCGMEPHPDMPQGKAVITGNPLRKMDTSDEKKKSFCQKYGINLSGFRVLCMGGSLGARAINEATLNLIHRFNENFFFIWICGKMYYDEYSTRLSERITERREGWVRGENFLLLPFFEEMGAIYGIVDIAITRAGAITLSELVNYSIPSVIIPSPNVVENHQMYNGLLMAREGAIILLTEERLNLLPEVLLSMIKTPSVIDGMKRACQKLKKRDAARSVAIDVLSRILSA